MFSVLGDPPALTVDNIVRVCIGAGVKWTRVLCRYGLFIPESKIDEIERSSPTSKGRLESSIDYYLCLDPTPSWRRIIHALDNDNYYNYNYYDDDQHSAASNMYSYAEQVTGIAK